MTIIFRRQSCPGIGTLKQLIDLHVAVHILARGRDDGCRREGQEGYIVDYVQRGVCCALGVGSLCSLPEPSSIRGLVYEF